MQSPEILLHDIAVEIKKTYSSELLQGRNALVTGGSRGIGRAIAIALGATGARVAINYAGNETAAAETAHAITTAGGEAKIFCFDVSDFSASQDAIKQIEKDFGGIDILVNNAGVSKDNLIVRMRETEWDSVIDINLKGAFNCCKAVSMGMLKRRSGKIINISSVIGLIGNAGQCAYAASKAGVFGLTMSLARELASRNVQVNAIAPGYITTDMTSALNEQITAQILSNIPLGRLGSPLDVAKLALFLASPNSNYITGQTIAIDGGMTM